MNETANGLNVNGSAVLMGSGLDPGLKGELREVRQSVEHLYS